MKLSKWFVLSVISLSLSAPSVFAAYYPTRGMSMTSVKAHYGQPVSITTSKGSVKRHWPKITVWHYGTFSVYFERNKVLHSVTH